MLFINSFTGSCQTQLYRVFHCYITLFNVRQSRRQPSAEINTEMRMSNLRGFDNVSKRKNTSHVPFRDYHSLGTIPDWFYTRSSNCEREWDGSAENRNGNALAYIQSVSKLRAREVQVVILKETIFSFSKIASDKKFLQERKLKLTNKQNYILDAILLKENVVEKVVCIKYYVLYFADTNF